jgi:hypothetical protein
VTQQPEWMKEQLNRAQVTLPNGYCTLPLTQPCEMRNACIDCDSYFVTTVEFLPTHRKQRDETVVPHREGRSRRQPAPRREEHAAAQASRHDCRDA